MVTGIPDKIWIVYQSIAEGGKRLVRIYCADLYQRICKESSEFHPVSDKWVSAPTKEELVMMMVSDFSRDSETVHNRKAGEHVRVHVEFHREERHVQEHHFGVGDREELRILPFGLSRKLQCRFLKRWLSYIGWRTDIVSVDISVMMRVERYIATLWYMFPELSQKGT